MDRVFENASPSLKAALDKKDLLGVQVAYKLLESSTKKVDCLTKNHEELSKKRDKLEEKRRNTTDNLFANIKETKNKFRIFVNYNMIKVVIFI